MVVRASTRFRRERTAVPSARAFATRALAAGAMPAETVEPLVLAVAEACNNVILHAAGDDFTVSVVIDDGRALVTVADRGAGFVPPAHPAMPGPLATGHRGLALMEALVDDVDVVSDGAGTTVMLVQSFVPDGHRSSVTTVD
jgi:serine/threonine-protein kinase RsbW